MKNLNTQTANICTHTSARVHTHTHTHNHAHTQTHTLTQTHTHTHTQTHTLTNTHTQTHTLTQAHTHLTHTQTHTLTHTHTHKHTPWHTQTPQGRGTDEKVFEKWKVFREDLKLRFLHFFFFFIKIYYGYPMNIFTTARLVTGDVIQLGSLIAKVKLNQLQLGFLIISLARVLVYSVQRCSL